MASVDLGTDVNYQASQLATFFSRASEKNQFDTSDCRDILPIVRGFAINNPDTFSVVECLDLCHVSVLDELNALEMFESWLMWEQGWRERYIYAKEISNIA